MQVIDQMQVEHGRDGEGLPTMGCHISNFSATMTTVLLLDKPTVTPRLAHPGRMYSTCRFSWRPDRLH